VANHKHIITIIEGRDENSKVVADLKAAAERKKWGFCHLKGIDPVKMAKFKLDDIPLENIVFRDLSENSHYDMARLKKWVDRNHKVAINMDAVGGRASTSDKYFQHGLFMLDEELKEHTLPIFQVDTAADVEKIIDAGELKYPVVLKPRLGTAGKGIKLARNREELFSAYHGPTNGILVEQYVKADRDWRVFVMGGTAVGIMRKTGDPEQPENFKIWSSGRNKAREEDPELIDILAHLACRAAGVSKLEYTGVDIIQDKRTQKFYVLETNFAAGWQNHFIEATGENIADRVVEWIEDRAKMGEVMQGSAKIDLSAKTELIKDYIEKRLERLPRPVAEEYRKIMAGDKEALAMNKKVLDKYDCYKLEDIPLSWAGNFIGPDVGTLEEGAIISAVWMQELKNTKDS